MMATAPEKVVYIEKSTVGVLARPLTLRQQKTMGRTSTKRMPKIDREAIPTADMPVF